MPTRAQYLCNECKIPRNIIFTDEMKEKYIPKDLNGLALYSDIHSCINGISGVNNLYIDHDMNVRSYKYVKLPQYQFKKPSAPGVPSAIPGVSAQKRPQIRITQIRTKDDLKMVIEDNMTGSDIIIGSINLDHEAPVKTVSSEQGYLRIKFYYSETRYTSFIERWLIEFINHYELFKPLNIGVIIEVIKFIIEGKEAFPTEFDINIIKIILASHEIFSELNEDADTSFLEEMYDKDGRIMLFIVEMLRNDPLVTMHEMASRFHEDIVYIIYCYLLLEKHGIILIHKPGIFDE